MSTMKESANKQLFELAARQMGISESFVEKDWHVTQALKAISNVRQKNFQLVFSGGTALSKAHKLIQRFSEDIDFIIVAPDETQSRKARSKLKHDVFNALSEAGFTIDENQVVAKNENRFFSIELEYHTIFERPHSLRPHIQIEMTVKSLQLPPVERCVSSFVNELKKTEPEVAEIYCMDPVENAADKLSAIVWRIFDQTQRGEIDRSLVRHFYDLALLKEAALNHSNFKKLVACNMEQDKDRPAASDHFSKLAISDRFNFLLNTLEKDDTYQKEYDLFIKGFSYAKTGMIPNYQTAVDAIKAMVPFVVT
ncbi:MAG: hypothetical protein ACD_62C00240G0008 [uncultured bacterium]|nr:MAG: hypothetical protein ACD_62C00240G0008 [uncultured bacterium]